MKILARSRSVSQPRLNISINVSLDDILWIAEPFVTKPRVSCAKKRVDIFKVKVTVTVFVFIQWNHDYFYYVFWTADFLATNLVWQCMFISWSVLWKSCFVVVKVKVTLKVLNFSECFPGQYLWSIKLSMVRHHHQPEYHQEISFSYVQGQSHNRFY